MKTVRTALIAVLLFASAAFAMDFSAEMVNSSPQGAVTAKFYVSGQKSRVEMPGIVTINRMDKKTMWMLMPGQSMYIEQPLDIRTVISAQEKMDGEVERVVEGKDMVNGVSTTKYRVTFDAGGKRETVFQWIDDVNHFPVKTAARDGSWSSEFKNVKTGPQDPSLFEIPSGYNKMPFTMPGMDR